jgi:hypothetical protein
MGDKLFAIPLSAFSDIAGGYENGLRDSGWPIDGGVWIAT